MQITDLLGQMGGIHSVAKELGVDEQQATRGAAALIPALLGGFKKQVTSQPAGVAGLGTMLGRLGGGNLLDEVLSPQPTDLNHGNAVLGQIFGSKEVSRAVAQNAAATSGLDPSLLKKSCRCWPCWWPASWRSSPRATPLRSSPHQAVASASYWEDCLAVGAAAATPARDSPRCLISTVTAIPSTTSCSWSASARASELRAGVMGSAFPPAL